MSETTTRVLIGAGCLFVGIGANEYRHNQNSEPAIEASAPTTTNPNQVLLPPTTTTVGLGNVAVTTTLMVEKRIYANYITCEGQEVEVKVDASDAFPSNIPGTASVLRAADRSVGTYPGIFSSIENEDLALAVAQDMMVQGGVSQSMVDTKIEINNVPIGTTFEILGFCHL